MSDLQRTVAEQCRIAEHAIDRADKAEDLAHELAERHQAEASAFDLVAHLQRQRDWSEKTFGPGHRAAGVLDHIRKELKEIEADPRDLTEWIDVVILAFDGAWRAGHTPEQIARALAHKQEKNESRQWPDWRTAEPGKAIEHVRDQSAKPWAEQRCQKCGLERSIHNARHPFVSIGEAKP